MSSFVIRPFLPEPATALILTPFSRAYLRTEGIALIFLFSSTSSSCEADAAGASSVSALASSLAGSSLADESSS